MGAADLGVAAARERAAQAEAPAPEEPQGPQMVVAQTAFIVAWVDGQVIISADLNSPIAVQHYPTPDEILGAAAILAADRTAERAAGLSAETTVELMAQKQREAMQKMQQAQLEAQARQALDAEKKAAQKQGRG